MFKKVYSLYPAFCTQPAFYSQSAVCILNSVCILPLVRSLQSAVRSLRFTLTVRFEFANMPNSLTMLIHNLEFVFIHELRAISVIYTPYLSFKPVAAKR